MQRDTNLPSLIRDSICFKDVIWLQTHQLGHSTVLDYFSTSPFYEKSCNNEILKMQQRPVTESTLSMLIGIEYIVAESSTSSSCYIIYHQLRKSPTSVQLLQVYYVLDGVIYSCPNLHDLVVSRLRTSLYHISKAMDKAIESNTFTSLSGHAWNKDTTLDLNHEISTDIVQRMYKIINIHRSKNV